MELYSVENDNKWWTNLGVLPFTFDTNENLKWIPYGQNSTSLENIRDECYSKENHWFLKQLSRSLNKTLMLTALCNTQCLQLEILNKRNSLFKGIDKDIDTIFKLEVDLKSQITFKT